MIDLEESDGGGPQVIGSRSASSLETSRGSSQETSRGSSRDTSRGSSLRHRSPSADFVIAEVHMRDTVIKEKDVALEFVAAIPPGVGWTVLLTGVCTYDLLSSGAVIFFSCSHAFSDGGISLYSVALQALLHLVSSLLLVLRLLGDLVPKPEPTGEYFANAATEESLLHERMRRDEVRERTLGRIVAGTMAVSSSVLVLASFVKLRRWDTWHEEHGMLDSRIATISELLAWYGAAAYSVQASCRFAASRLPMATCFVWHCGVLSALTVVSLAVLGFAASMEQQWSWKAEPIAALVLAALGGLEAWCFFRSQHEVRMTRLCEPAL